MRGEEVKTNNMREGERSHQIILVETENLNIFKPTNMQQAERSYHIILLEIEDLDILNRDLPMPDQEFEMELEN